MMFHVACICSIDVQSWGLIDESVAGHKMTLILYTVVAIAFWFQQGLVIELICVCMCVHGRARTRFPHERHMCIVF